MCKWVRPVEFPEEAEFPFSEVRNTATHNQQHTSESGLATMFSREPRHLDDATLVREKRNIRSRTTRLVKMSMMTPGVELGILPQTSRGGVEVGGKSADCKVG